MASPPTEPGDPATAETLTPATAPTLDVGTASTIPATRPGEDAAVAAGPRPGVGAQVFRRSHEGRFVVEKELARGGMGRVLAALDRDLDRPVALKQLLDPTVASAARFRREVRITARLQHPAIVPVYEAGIDADGQPFFAMKKVEGRPLDAAIAACTSLSARLALLPKIIAVAEALAFAHSRGIVHRDLKPANVLVGAFGETVVIDWGIARDLASPDEAGAPIDATPKATPEGLTMAGAVMGTPAYMPPEQARGEEVDARADVYALGAMLFELLSGRAPYDGTSSVAILASVLSGDPEPTRTLPADAPAELRTIVLRAMARDKSERYADAGALARDLTSYQTGQLVGAHRYTARDLISRWARRHRGALLTSALALVAITSLGVWSYVEVTRERNAALAAQAVTEAARRDALDEANAALVARAQSFVEHDPARALATLGRLSVDGSGWDEAHTVAASAVARGLPSQLYSPGVPGRSTPVWSPDGHLVARAFGARSLGLFDVAAGTHRVVSLPSRADTEWVESAFADDGASVVLFGPVCHECREDDARCGACDATRLALIVDVASLAVRELHGSDAIAAAARVIPALRARIVADRVMSFDPESGHFVDRGPRLPDTSDANASYLLLPSQDASAAVEAVGDAEGVWTVRRWRFDTTPATVSAPRTLEGEWLFATPDARQVVLTPATLADALALVPPEMAGIERQLLPGTAPVWSWLLETPEHGGLFAMELDDQISFTPDASRVMANCSSAPVATFWSLSGAAAVVAELPGPPSSSDASFSPDGTTAALLEPRRLTLVHLEASRATTIGTVAGDLLASAPLERARFSPDGTRVAVGGATTLSIWDVAAVGAPPDPPSGAAALHAWIAERGFVVTSDRASTDDLSDTGTW